MVHRNYSSDTVVLRLAIEDDKELLLAWANDLTVRKWSFINTYLISHDDHLDWFKKVISDKNIQLWILEVNNTPCGQVRAELEDRFAVIHYSIDHAFRGKNLGSKMLTMVINKICLEWDVLEIRAFTVPENIASNKSLEHAGFKEISSNNGKKSYVYHCG